MACFLYSICHFPLVFCACTGLTTRSDPTVFKDVPPEQIEKFCKPSVQVTLGFKHPRYGHMVVMQEEVRAVLAEDFG